MYNDSAPVRNKIYGVFCLVSSIFVLASAFWILYETHDANAKAQQNFIPREADPGFQDLVRYIREDVVQFWAKFPVYTRLILCQSIAIIIGLLMILLSIWLFSIKRGSENGRSWQMVKVLLDLILLGVYIGIWVTVGPLTTAFIVFLIITGIYLIISFIFVAFLRF